MFLSGKNEMQDIFSKTFKNEELSQLNTAITELIKSCSDELYLVINNHHRVFNTHEQNESATNRAELATQYETSNLLNPSTFDNTVLRYVLCLTGMFDRIESKTSNYPIISQLFGKSIDLVTTPLDVEIKLTGGVQTYKEANGQITIKPQNRSATLIVVMLMLYRHGNIIDYVKNITKSIKTDIYHALQHLIEALNTAYDIPHLDAQYRTTQVSLFMHACDLLTTWNGDQQTLSTKPLLLPLCSICPVNFELCTAHILLGSIYQHNQSCEWFNVNTVNEYVKKYSNLPMTLGVFFNDHERWATMYAFASLYSLNFLNLIDTNRLFDTNTVPTSELTTNLLRSRNNALIFSESAHYYVIEMINGVKLVSSSAFTPSKAILRENENQVTTYVIRSPSVNGPGNFVCAAYDINELKTYVQQLREGAESINTNVTISPSTNTIKLGRANTPQLDDIKPQTPVIAYICAILTTIMLIVVVVYIYRNPNKLPTKSEVIASESLL